jgi:hypothetical protein
MKKNLTAILFLLIGAIFVALLTRPVSAQSGSFQSYEYVTIRWGGRENTHLIRSNGSVEFLKPLLAKASRPDHADDRSFYMNIAMNAVAKEGYEFAGMTTDEVVMKRAVSGRQQ